MIKLFKPTLKRKDMDSVLNTMVDEAIGPGEKYKEFSHLIRDYFEAESCTLMRSYVSAFETACNLLHLGKDSKVIISPLSPSWYVDILEKLQSSILFADVDQYTGCISPEAVKELLPQNPSALIIHDPFGNLPDYKKLSQIPIPIIEDITQGFGTRKNEYKPGEIASIIISAFEEESVITTGGGAALILNEKKYIKPLQELVDITGKLELMPDMNAALGIVQFKAMSGLIERRREYLALFRSSVSKTKHKILIESSDLILANGYVLPILLDSRIKEVNKFTRRYKIETVNPFESCAVSRVEVDQNLYPNSIPFRLRTLFFPLYPLLSKDQLKTLVKVLSTLP
ncbi:MAG: DegT/DnrJ/EryC1/StrS aminotransferase family protein [Bacteroidetes bacterium]|nr:DegT/DnrJ/EryC1/StrS aminotransferase family protein [Bacteroidota bacterium]